MCDYRALIIFRGTPQERVADHPDIGLFELWPTTVAANSAHSARCRWLMGLMGETRCPPEWTNMNKNLLAPLPFDAEDANDDEETE